VDSFVVGPLLPHLLGFLTNSRPAPDSAPLSRLPPPLLAYETLGEIECDLRHAGQAASRTSKLAKLVVWAIFRPLSPMTKVLPMRLLPRDEKFFDLFTSVASLSVDAAKLQIDLLKADGLHRPPIVDAIKRLEHEADQVTHEVVTRLDRVFITPLDREDIHLLASRLDDVVDLIDGAAHRVQMYRAGEAPAGAVLLAEVIVRATQSLLVAVQALEKNKSGVVLEACAQVKRLEEEGDSVYHEWVARLFDGNPDALVVIKWKEIYDTLEKTLDHMEDAGNVLESISIKHA
jgi:predicted phosphate transport protein (TIGR00153 family)